MQTGVSKDTLIATFNGDKRVDQLAIGDSIMTETCETASIIDVMKSVFGGVIYTVVTDFCEITLAENQPIKCGDGRIVIPKYLRVGDSIKSENRGDCFITDVITNKPRYGDEAYIVECAGNGVYIIANGLYIADFNAESNYAASLPSATPEEVQALRNNLRRQIEELKTTPQ